MGHIITEHIRHRQCLLLFLISAILLTVSRARALDFVSANGYRCAIPSGWRAGQLPTPGPDIVLFGPSGADGTPNITIVTNDAAGATLSDVKDAVNGSSLHPQQGYRRVSQTIHPLNGDMVLETVISYLLPAPMGRTQADQVDFLKNGREYEFTCTASEPKFADTDRLFSLVLKSLQWPPPAAESTASDVKRAFYGKQSYAVILPDGWEVNKSMRPPDGDIVLAGPADQGHAPNISIRVRTAPPGQTLEAEQESVLSQHPSSLLHFTLRSQIITTADDAPTLETLYSLGEGAGAVSGCQAYILKGDTVFLVTGTFPMAGHEGYDALFSRLLQSWRWTD